MKLNVGKFGMFYALLSKMQGVTKEEIVSQYSGGTSLSELYERAPRTYKKMIEDMKRIVGNEGSTEEMDKQRKRVIASIAGYFEKAGLYIDLSRREKLQKIISTACRAAGITDFNAMTATQMKRVYAEFARKQKTAVTVEKIEEEARKETGKVIRRGCLTAVIK